MSAKKSTGAQVQTVHCSSCGEDYAATYKYCPFCDWVEETEEEGGRGRMAGSRYSKNSGRRRGGGYQTGVSIPKIIGITCSLALFIAAVWIVISVLQPMIDKGQTTMPEVTATPEPTVEPTVAPTPEPTETIPTDQTATSFTLNYDEFSLSNSYPTPIQLTATFAPVGSTGYITWESSDPSVVTVNDVGLVSYGTTTGQATITATMAGGYTQTCLVRSTVTLGAASAPTTTTTTTTTDTTSSSGLDLNYEDFTMSSSGETVTMKVSGNSGTPTWSVGNTAVATISSEGKVTAVGTGSTTVYCEVDGETMTCIVRCNW